MDKLINSGYGDRLRDLRKSLKKTQIEFADCIKTTNGHVSDMEKERKNLSERSIKIICDEFNVNENWLRFGDGNMFIPVDDLDMRAKYIDELLFNNESSFYNLINNILSAYSQLNQAEMEVADKIIDKVLENYRNS